MTPEQLVRKVTAITGYTHAAGVETLAIRVINTKQYY